MRLASIGAGENSFDLVHVSLNKKQTKVKRRYPPVETPECEAHRHGFGSKKSYSVVLRIANCSDATPEGLFDGLLEYPDCGAAVIVKVKKNSSPTHTTLSITELSLHYGQAHGNWYYRFGTPTYQPGSEIFLTSKTKPKSKSKTKLLVKPSESTSSNRQSSMVSGAFNYTPPSLWMKNGGVLTQRSDFKLKKNTGASSR